MATTFLQAIMTQPTTMTDLKTLLVPTFINATVVVKRKTVERLPVLETEIFSNDDNFSRSSSCSEINEENGHLPNINDDETQTYPLEVLDSGADDEDVIEIIPPAKPPDALEPPQPSSNFFQPFTNLNESQSNERDNSVVKVPCGEKIPNPQINTTWMGKEAAYTSFANCHPFKKSALTDDKQPNVPVQHPQSPRQSRTRKKSPQQLSPKPRTASPEVVTDGGNTSNSESPKTDDNKTGDSGSWRGKGSSKKKKSNRETRNRAIGYVTSDRLLELKNLVDSAVREHKIYSMSGAYPSVRSALKQRGWIEKLDSEMKPRRRSKMDDLDTQAADLAQRNAITATGLRPAQTNHNLNALNIVEPTQEPLIMNSEMHIVNRMLRNITEDLCWLNKPYAYAWKDISKYEMVNRLPKAYFSNKVGLCNSLQQLHWYMEPGVSTTQFPRTYNISHKDELEAFKDDFRITACVCTLKWLTINYKSGGEKNVRSQDGRVDTYAIEFALRRCAEYVKMKEHEDIDSLDPPTIWEHQWDHFLTQYYKLVNDGALLKDKDEPPIQVLVCNAQSMLNLLRPHWPQLDIEGMLNMWIMKPGNRCCGNGIVIKNHLENVLAMVNPSITKETRYVVQKYIERPLLVYNTKFDIRQWFLVTSVYPLTIWMYKESYLRFCSQQFTLKSVHESIHLCNNAVQRRYKNSKRDRALPDENMWDCYTFKTYLRAIGQPDAWDNIIYPGMKEGFIGALLASQDNMERRKNCFELYGADFMVSEELTDGPWLIEINSNPAMESSTSVTARMCPQVLEDIVKVVIDRKLDKNADTGSFELIYKQNCPPIPPYLGMSLSIKGKKICKTPSEAARLAAKRSKKNMGKHLHDSDTDTSDEGNIVQKRCTTDFMQPIKTLIETIRVASATNIKSDTTIYHDVLDRPVSTSEFDLSDALYDDSDDSDASDSKPIALAGKEMELRQKTQQLKPKVLLSARDKSKNQSLHSKVKKDDLVRSENPEKENTDADFTENEKENKDQNNDSDDGKRGSRKNARRKRGKEVQKTDYIRKNIENLETRKRDRRRNILTTNNRIDDNKVERLCRSSGIEVYKNTECDKNENDNSDVENVFLECCADEGEDAPKTSHDELETKFREEMQKMLDTGECKQFLDSQNGEEFNVFGADPSSADESSHYVSQNTKFEEKSFFSPYILTSFWKPSSDQTLRVPVPEKIISNPSTGNEEKQELKPPVVETTEPKHSSRRSPNCYEMSFMFGNKLLENQDTEVYAKNSPHSANKVTAVEDGVASEHGCDDSMANSVRLSVCNQDCVLSDLESDIGLTPTSNRLKIPNNLYGEDEPFLDIEEAQESMSDFDRKFERELQMLELQSGSTNFMAALNISQQDLLMKRRGKPPRWTNHEALKSMEYFREWKYKVDKTRKSCEDMLAKLKAFKEANSKLKFYDVLRKRVEYEEMLLEKLNEYKRTRVSKYKFDEKTKIKDTGTRKVNQKVEIDNNTRKQSGKEEMYLTGKTKDFVANFFGPTVSDRIAKVEHICKPRASKAVKYQLKQRRKSSDDKFMESRYILKPQLEHCPTTAPALCINRESGAVTNVNGTLPKIKQRNRPSLPNATSGHGRTLDKPVVDYRLLRAKSSPSRVVETNYLNLLDRSKVVSRD